MHHNLKFVVIGCCAVRLLGRYRQKRRDRDRRMYVGRDPHIFRRGRQAEPGKRLTVQSVFTYVKLMDELLHRAIRRARDLLIELVGGEPGEQTARSIRVISHNAQAKPAGSSRRVFHFSSVLSLLETLRSNRWHPFRSQTP